MAIEMISIDDFRKLDNAIESAKQSDVPYASVINDEIHVMGNPNNTELIKHNYRVKFAFPKTKEWLELAKKQYEIDKETDNYIVAFKEYKDVWVTPRKVGKCIEAFTRIISFMNMANEEGDVEKLTEEQMLEMLKYLNDDVEDAIYEAVARVIGISEDEAEFMTIDSAMYNAAKIVNDHPDLINTSDLFFGSSQGIV